MGDAINLSNLLPFSRIASVSKGHLTVHSDNLHVILQSVAHLSEETPVAIAAVIGPKLTGTYFFSNFMVQYVSKCGAEGWMRETVSRIKIWEPMMKQGDNNWGFPRSVKLAKSFQGDGIYLWPQTYLIRKDRNPSKSQLLLWIIHGEINELVNESPAKKFLALMCSNIIEIKWEANSSPLQLLELHRQVLQTKNLKRIVRGTDLCRSCCIVIRREENISQVTLTEATGKEALKELVEDVDRRLTYDKILDKFQDVNWIWIQDVSSQHLSSSQKITSEAESIPTIPAIAQIVEQFLNENKIVPKTTSASVLTLANMEQFIKMTSQKTNQWEKLTPDLRSVKIFKAQQDLEALESLKQFLEQEIKKEQTPAVNDLLPVELKCPVCVEIYQSKVFICLNGHALCDKCFERVNECPECRVPLTDMKIRCRALESMICGWKWDCAYKEKGCKEKLLCGEMNIHMATCQWRLGTEQRLQLHKLTVDIAKTKEELHEIELNSEAEHKLPETGNKVGTNCPCCIIQ